MVLAPCPKHLASVNSTSQELPGRVLASLWGLVSPGVGSDSATLALCQEGPRRSQKCFISHARVCAKSRW